MTHLCYSLEEASERLGLSETVLVRLSQYFKVPRAAYEEAGYLSFKGDLAFSDQDIAFFQQVKERLLAGETLDTVRSRMREDAVPISPRRPTPKTPGATKPAEADWQASSLPMAPLAEVQDRAPYEQAAEESFQRYKSKHRAGLGKVFENMLKEVGAVADAMKPAASERPIKATVRPRVKPLHSERSGLTGSAAKSSGLPGPELMQLEQALLPFQSARNQKQDSRLWQAAPQVDESWDEMIREAASRPRTLNAHLKNAATLLRNRALHQADSQAETRPR